MKITFQNVRTINDEKTRILSNTLKDYDLLCLSELNKNYDFDRKTINDGNFQYHTDVSTNRIGIMASNTMNIEVIGVGLKLEQVRARENQTAVQSYVYKTSVMNRNVYIENVYVTPDINCANLKNLISHLHNQSRRYRYYLVGGDFNLNWKTACVKDLFRDLNLTQVVKDYTRVQMYKKKFRNSDGVVIKETTRTSKTLIDLVFTSMSLRPFVKGVLVDCLYDKFDHKAVTITLDFPSSSRYRYINIPLDPLQRPTPKECHIEKIKERIGKIRVNNLDGFTGCIKDIFNKYIPTYPINSSTRKKIFRTPLVKEEVADIYKKNKMYTFRKASQYNWNRYKEQRNKVVKIVRRAKSRYCSTQIKKFTKANEIQHCIDRLSNHFNSKLHDNKQILKVEGFSGVELANKMADFYKYRAEQLVPDSVIKAAGTPEPVLRNGEYIEPMKSVKFAKLEKLNEFIPTKKLTKTQGPSEISSKLIAVFWDDIKDKLEPVLRSDDVYKYPTVEQGYYQRTIPKKADIEILKDLRPLGILNPIPKYFLNKTFFSKIRDHISPILVERNNFSFRGTHLCIIQTFDKILDLISKKIPTFLVKYDFSNAFGTISHELLLQACSSLNFTGEVLKFIEGYLHNQKSSITVVRDQSGSYLSRKTIMNRGTVQGQIGADICFTIQQLCLREDLGVHRSIYVDDINDIVSGMNLSETIKLLKSNETSLSDQSKRIGFKLNEDKTEHIPFNIKDSKLDDLAFTRSSKLLGLPFKATSTGFKLDTATDMICKRLQFRCRKVHILRQYVTDIWTLLFVARSFVYQSIGELHLIYAYEPRVDSTTQFNRVLVKTNDILRATGLSIMTPKSILDAVLGTKLETFVQHQILLTGMKILGAELHQKLDRSLKFRFKTTGYMSTFTTIWNNLDFTLRKEISKIATLDKIKTFLKNVLNLKNVKFHMSRLFIGRINGLNIRKDYNNKLKTHSFHKPLAM